MDRRASIACSKAWGRWHRGIAAAIAAAMACSGAAAAHAQSLPASMAQACQVSPQLNAARAQQRATDEGVPQALAGYRPQKAADVGSTRLRTTLRRDRSGFQHNTPARWSCCDGISEDQVKSALWVVALSISAQSAAAQVSFSTPPNPPSSFAEQTIKVTTSFRAPLAVADGQTVPDAKAQEAARWELYRMTEHERAGLSEIYKAECHLTSVAINVAFPLPPGSPPPNALSATAIYEPRRNRPTP